jgi:hypothetical protein
MSSPTFKSISSIDSDSIPDISDLESIPNEDLQELLFDDLEEPLFIESDQELSTSSDLQDLDSLQEDLTNLEIEEQALPLKNSSSDKFKEFPVHLLENFNPNKISKNELVSILTFYGHHSSTTQKKNDLVNMFNKHISQNRSVLMKKFHNVDPNTADNIKVYTGTTPSSSPKTKAKTSPKPKAKRSPKPKAKTSPKPKAKRSPKPKAKTSPKPKAKRSPKTKNKN